MNVDHYTPFTKNMVADYQIGMRALGLLEALVDHNGEIDPALILRFARNIVADYRANHQPSTAKEPPPPIKKADGPQTASLSEQPGNF